MCGIAGIVGMHEGAATPGRESLLRMASALYHRGPDESGLYRDDRAGLAHTRLSIIDLASGQQPMADAAGRFWIVFNGEIFNYVELRKELLDAGHVFRTHSDTEVILQAYLQWGEAAFERFNGQWAVAIWDRLSRKLILARDSVGICPLHICEFGGHVYFASEVKAIFAANAQIPRMFDPVGIAQTFTFWTIVPPQGIFDGVSELEPGHLRIYENGGMSDRVYWRPQYPVAGNDERAGFTGTLDDAVKAVRKGLEAATAMRMLRADVPVGSYLSGGLDSSLVAALGRKYAGEHFQTFSLRFDDAEYDESEYQKLVVKMIGSEHHEVMVTREDIARIFPDVIYHTERPILRTAPAPLFMLSGLVREHGIKVVLTGEGADEMFAGYDIFREGKVRRFWGRQPDSAWRHRLLERLYPYLARSPVSQQAMARQFFGRNISSHKSAGFAHDTRWQTTGALKRLLSHDMRQSLIGRDIVAEFLQELHEDFSGWSHLAQDQHIEIRTLLSGYLLSSQGDRMLLAHSVEGRFPFLDKELMELADALPASHKLRVLDEKHVIKKSALDIVPREILERKKQPYRAPDALSFVSGKVPEYVSDVLSEASLRESNVFEPEVVVRLLKKCRSQGGASQFSNADNMALVGAMSVQLLHGQYIARCPSGSRMAPLKVDVDRTSQLMRA